MSGFTRGGLLLTCALTTALAGCRIVSLDEDRALRARRGAGFDAQAEVRRMWDAQALPALQRAAQPLAELLPQIDADLAKAGARFGRRAGEGAPWTFVGRGEGVVTAVDTASPRGTIAVSLTSSAGPRTVRIQVGPIVGGTAIRDALPTVAFNDYPDQLAFADVGHALTTRALAAVRSGLAGLRPGARLSFVGAFNVSEHDDPILITPVTIATAPRNAG